MPICKSWRMEGPSRFRRGRRAGERRPDGSKIPSFFFNRLSATELLINYGQHYAPLGPVKDEAKPT